MCGRISAQAETGRRRTPWGDPDLQGQWNSQTADAARAAADGRIGWERDYLTDEEAEEVEKENRDWSTMRRRRPATPAPTTRSGDESEGAEPHVADPRPAGRSRATPTHRGGSNALRPSERRERASAGRPIATPICRSGLAASRAAGTASAATTAATRRSFSRPGYVVVLQELIHEPRIIPLDGRPGLAGDVQPWLGVSRGHWEGDTLVVETRNFDARSSYRGSSTDLRPDGTRTREHRRTRSTTSFTMHDPGTYVSDWTVGRPMRRRRMASRSSNMPATRATSR